ncbi:MAG: gluconeogenesis factor YvcK family protein [Candidatus Sericytochromatia bacterium]|nr:gluconeogenesis factor YvcK family protein [Candidatus Sericytochromatia bacterium]
MGVWRDLRTWALPGMRIKRWLFLLVGGVIATNSAVALAVYEWSTPSRLNQWSLVVPCILLFAGIFALTQALQRLIALLVDVLRPGAQLVDAVYANRARKRGPKIVAIGGGTGLSTLLRGLKKYSDNITAVVTVADDGGSSGRLRQELGVLPPGDIRNCLSALAGEERLLTDLFNFRFPGKHGVGGHSFGNLFLAAVMGVSGDPLRAIEVACQVLAVRGTVIPATAEPMTLYARFEDGAVVEGESNITAWQKRVTDLWAAPANPAPVPAAVKAIEEADAIIIGPGSLYTSLVPHLLVPGLRDALRNSRAPRIYVCNVMTQAGETDGFSAGDHLRVLQQYGGAELIQYIMVNEELPRRLREAYESQGQYPVRVDWPALRNMGIEIASGSLLDEVDGVRHHPDLLATALVNWWESRQAAHRSSGRDQTTPSAA